jgi:hypothetical protein
MKIQRASFNPKANASWSKLSSKSPQEIALKLISFKDVIVSTKKIITFETVKVLIMFLSMKYFLRILIAFLIITSVGHAQTLDEAKKLYLDGDYVTSLPVFEEAVKSSPQNASYNQWYGTCLLETGRPEEAVAYLNFAASKNIIEAYASLGRTYYRLYQFDESVHSFEKYEEALIKDKKPYDSDKIKTLIDSSKRASRILSHIEDVQIIDSVILDKNQFLNAYLIGQDAGALKYIEDKIIYENSLSEKRYYARPNENGKLRLFSLIKLQDKWSDERELTIISDSLEDNNYPFVMPDGFTIYYATTGQGSLGGYDLFITRYNANNGTYLAPSQLGMPFNSIANDYMMAIDEHNNVGYFATDRFQPADKVIVYTFIPNKNAQTINSDDESELIRRATITSIRDTWKSETDYSNYLSEIKKNILEEQIKSKREFCFVINDNIVYYNLGDFENGAAKQSFAESQELKKQINHLENELDALQQSYANGNNSQKESLKTKILTIENRLPVLYKERENQLFNARMFEIKYLRLSQEETKN